MRPRPEPCTTTEGAGAVRVRSDQMSRDVRVHEQCRAGLGERVVGVPVHCRVPGLLHPARTIHLIARAVAVDTQDVSRR